jgi:hypothetical protein
MVAVASFWADDPETDAADIASAERDLTRLRYATVRDGDHRTQLEKQIATIERCLQRMRSK